MPHRYAYCTKYLRIPPLCHTESSNTPFRVDLRVIYGAFYTDPNYEINFSFPH